MKEKIFLKNVVTFLILFIVIAIGITFGLIKINLEKTDSKGNKGNSGDGGQVSVTPTPTGTPQNKSVSDTDKYKVKMYDAYYTNNIEIEYESAKNKKNEEVQYVKIDGLKNEKIETKINSMIKEKVINCADGSFSKCWVYANFSNILSIGINGKYITIDLSTGNEIKLADCFDGTIDLQTKFGCAANLAQEYEGAFSERVDDTEDTMLELMNKFKEGKYELTIGEDGDVIIIIPLKLYKEYNYEDGSYER